jgi:hypothetical protein
VDGLAQPEGVLFALTLAEQGERFSTAQERSLATWRDATANAATTADLIAPAPAVQALLDAPSSLSATRRVVPTNTEPAARTAPAGKTTTAAAFFHKKAAESATSSSSADSKKKPVATKSSVAKSKVAAKANNPFAKAVGASNRSKSAASATQDEKENCLQAKAALATVGNADDFEGDMDEDDDDDEEEVEIAEPPVVVREGVKAVVIPKDDHMVVDDEEELETKKSKAKPTVYGAMDDFAKAKQPDKAAQSKDGDAPRRKRRKVWKKHLTQDSRGYMHEEMQEVWEDIPSDEEREAQTKVVAQSRPKKKVVKAAGMKQGNLMGFFKKK